MVLTTDGIVIIDKVQSKCTQYTEAWYPVFRGFESIIAAVFSECMANVKMAIIILKHQIKVYDKTYEYEKKNG